MRRLFIAVLCGFFVFSSALFAYALGKVTGGINFEVSDYYKDSF